MGLSIPTLELPSYTSLLVLFCSVQHGVFSYLVSIPCPTWFLFFCFMNVTPCKNPLIPVSLDDARWYD
jgi:hypothetical protein